MATTAPALQGPEPWQLYYWPGMKGRGEYVRLVFEEAGVPYVDVCRQEGSQMLVDLVFKGIPLVGPSLFPVRAPPLVVKGTFSLCNTPCLVSFLGRQFGLVPTDAVEAAHCDQCVNVALDAVSEGRLAFHPKDFYASHSTQVEESQAPREQYGELRLPKYLDHFEAVLTRNAAVPGGWLVGTTLSVADLVVYHFLAAAETHYSDVYEKLMAAHPRCGALKAAVTCRPKVAAYLASDRCPPWDKDSMM